MAAICHAPWVLIDAGVVRGRKLTSWEHIQTDVKNAGGNWINEEVVVDNGFVTSRKPDDIPAFKEDDRRILPRETRQADAVCRGRARDIIRGNIEVRAGLARLRDPPGAAKVNRAQGGSSALRPMPKQMRLRRHIAILPSTRRNKFSRARGLR